MFTKSDKLWLKKNFTTKNDLKRFATKDDLKKLVTKDDAKNFATKDDLKRFATKDDLKSLAKQKDLLEVKKNLDDLTEFIKDSIPPIFKWTDEIHETIVKENLPERVRKLEHIIKSS